MAMTVASPTRPWATTLQSATVRLASSQVHGLALSIDHATPIAPNWTIIPGPVGEMEESASSASRPAWLAGSGGRGTTTAAPHRGQFPVSPASLSATVRTFPQEGFVHGT